MPEYTDKDALIERIKHIQTWWTCTGGSYFGPPVRVNYDDVISAIESAPPADVAPIVRCKDCKYAGEPQTPPYLLRRPDTLKCKCAASPCYEQLVDPQDFLSLWRSTVVLKTLEEPQEEHEKWRNRMNKKTAFISGTRHRVLFCRRKVRGAGALRCGTVRHIRR